MAMFAVEDLLRDITAARSVNAARQGAEISDRVRTILAHADRYCLNRSDVDAYLLRTDSVLRKFLKSFPEHREATLLRAPGRVNIIGEHTDYNGLPVLPMAINRDIMLAVSPRDDDAVQIDNLDARYEARRFQVSDRIEPFQVGDWGNYAKAAIQAIQHHFSESGEQLSKGFDAAISGTIPAASGLASSSALVVIFSLAILLANKQDMDPALLADVLATGEQYVGTRGGGMDQVICLEAREDTALKIDFFPTRSMHVPLPSGYHFVVCHSTIIAPKTAEARLSYNLRSAESHIAAALLAKVAGRKYGGQKPQIRRLGDLYSEGFGFSQAEIDSLREEGIPKETYTLDEVASLINERKDALCRSYLDAFSPREIDSLEDLKLRRRCRHVLSEGKRVQQAVLALKAWDMEELGRLMCESHESCANDFQISIPELDVLVAIAREEGALGARLTGAGFGGCTINLVRNSQLEEFFFAVKRRYYLDYLRGRSSESHNTSAEENIFVCRAVNGAGPLFC